VVNDRRVPDIAAQEQEVYLIQTPEKFQQLIPVLFNHGAQNHPAAVL
jgi:hypothetical protein